MSNSAIGIASSARTTTLPASTSAKPPRMNSRRSGVSPPLTSITPGRKAERTGAWPASTPKYPSAPGSVTMSTSSDKSSRSGDTRSKWILSVMWPVPAIAETRTIPPPSASHFVRRRTPPPRAGEERRERAYTFLPCLRGRWRAAKAARRRGACHLLRGFRGHLLGLLHRVLDGAHHVERGFRQVVVIAFHH